MENISYFLIANTKKSKYTPEKNIHVIIFTLLYCIKFVENWLQKKPFETLLLNYWLKLNK